MNTFKRFLSLFLISTLTISVWGYPTITITDGEDDDNTKWNTTNTISGSLGVISWTASSVTTNSSSSGSINFAANGSVTFTAATGYTISTIQMTTTTGSDSYYGNFSSNHGTVTISNSHDYSISGINSSSVTLTTSSAYRITNAGSVLIVYSAACTSEVDVTKGTETNGTYTLSATKACADGVGGTITISDITPASGYQFQNITTSASGVVDNENKKVTGIKAATTITVNFEPIPTYAIRFFNNGTQVGATQNLAEGATAVKPSNPDPCDEGYTFVGWWTSELDEDNTTSHTWVTDFTVSGNQDYYAVFSHAEGATGTKYSKSPSGSSDLVSGGSGTYYTLTIATGITVTISGWTNNPPVYHTDGQWRIYGGSSVVIASALGDISKIEFTSTQNNLSTSQGTYSDQTWTGDATSVTFTNSSTQSRITGIAVTVGDPGTTYYTTDCGTSCYTPTLAFEGSVTTVNKFVGAANFTITASPSNNPLGGTVTYSSSLPSKAFVNATTGEVTILDAMSTTPVVITATLGKVIDGSDCQKQVKVSYTLNIYNRVTWSVNGASYTTGSPTTQAVEGGTITAYPTDPDGSTLCGGKTFVGWTTSEIAVPQDSKPGTLYTSLASMAGVHITENTTYYAVFAESDSGGDEIFAKGTKDDLTEGQTVLIVHAATSKALSSTSTANKTLTPVSVSIDGSGHITNPATNLKWTVVNNTTSYQFMQGSGYLWAGYDNGYTLYCSDSYDDKWSVTANSSHYYIADVDYNDRKLEYYSTNDEFTTYTGTGDVYQMDFYIPASSYSDYSTVCGPVIKANEVERLTSTKDQTVKSQEITVKGSSLTGGTLSVKSITGAGASHFSCTLASTTITTGAIETTYTISYTPTVFGANHEATLVFTDGTTDSDPITLRGRSLPKHFVIVAYDGANYYALDGSMSGTANTVRPIPVTVTTPGVVDYAPTRAIYSLTDLDSPDQHVHLTTTTGRLYGEGSGTGLNIHSATSTNGTNWLLTTTDFENYHVTNGTTTTRGIMYNSTYDAFGHYATIRYGAANYYGDLQFMAYTNECTCLDAPQNVTAVAKATTATITWDEVPGAINYEVTCSGGSVSVDAVNRKATITGLTNLTTYSYSVKAVATGTDCSLARSNNFKTTNCDDVPYNIIITPAIQSATIKWQMEASSATIKIYSDEECTAQVGSNHTDKTSPATIEGLTENTTYYAKIFAGGTCESAAVEFQTNSTSVEVAEWFPDSIRILIDADASATVLIEDKKESGSTTTNVADKVFISKYFEADGNNKMIAIFNGTTDEVDITNYWLYRSEINAAEKKICLKKFGKTPGKIAPNEEIIIMRFTNSTDGAISCAEKEENYDEWNIINDGDTDGEGNNIYTWLQFSGPQSIGLWDNNTGEKKFIDVIGATTDDTGAGELVQINASQKTSCSHTENSNNDASGFFANGKNVKDGSDIVLSTNRCLLIRKNTVVSGIHAVETNIYATQQACNDEIGHAFQTLGDEWLGFIIGKGSDAAAKTCEGLAYVGGFDYNAYYVTYDSIGGLKELEGNRNSDGTYTISIPDLDTLSCSMMRVKVYEGKEEKASREYKVPIMVEDTKTTNDTIFKNKWHDLAACEECDVVILKGATLTKTNEGANDASTVRNLTIYPGGTMVVPNTNTFNVSSIQFRVEGEQTPAAKLKGDLITSDQQVIVSRRINNSRYYYFSLPYDCEISDVHWSNGTPAVNNVDYRIAEYDSEARALQGSTKGTPGHYKLFTGSTLKAGVGYVIATSDRYLKELVFPMNIGGTNLTDAEDNKTTNKVTLHQYTGPSSINNHNWNFIAHPYVSAFNAYNDSKITAGWLNCVSPQTETEDAVWEYVDDAHVYLTMPSFNAAKTTFTQTLSSTIGTINPFLGVFVQAVVDGEDLTFEEGNRVLSAPARFLAAKAENKDESIFVGVTLSGNGQSDQTNLRIRPDFTNEYQLGYDLLKFTTYYTERPQIFMKTPSHQLAFQAVNDSVVKNTFLPMGVYCEYAGTYTFALDENYPIDEVEAVYLYDKTTGATTNLLYDTYTITTSGRLNSTSRFSLNVRLNRKVPQITTGFDALNAPNNMVRKILINGHVYIQRGGAIYDVTGKEVFNF